MAAKERVDAEAAASRAKDQARAAKLSEKKAREEGFKAKVERKRQGSLAELGLDSCVRRLSPALRLVSVPPPDQYVAPQTKNSQSKLTTGGTGS